MENRKISEIALKIEDGVNLIIGQAHFIKTVEDLYEALVSASSSIKFAIAFNEASGERLIRFDGNDDALADNAVKFAESVGAGHLFVILLKDSYPINVVNRIKEVDEVLNIYVATANPVKVLVYDDGEGGRSIVGVIDGKKPLGVEDSNQKEKRHKFLRDIGYKR